MAQNILERFDKFAKGLSKRDRVAVLTDYDADGLAAGAILVKAVKKITGHRPRLVFVSKSKAMPLDESIVKELEKNKINKLVCADISADQKATLKLVEKITRFAQVLNIDHHKIYSKVKNRKILVIKPGFFSKKDSARYCSAKMCFDLFSRITDLNDSSWLAALGLFGDFGIQDWQTFYKSSLKKAGLSEKDIKKMSYTLTAVKGLKEERLEECLEKLASAENPRNCLKKYYPLLEKSQEIIRREERKFWKKAEFFKKLGLYFHITKRKVSIISALISKISVKKPGKTIIIGRLKEGKVSFSARRQDRKVAMNLLLEESVKGLKNTSAGGHVPAAGAKIHAQDLEKFKQNLLEVLKEKYKNQK